MKLLASEHIPAFFAGLAERFRLLVPVMLPDGTRSLGTLADGPLSLIGGALPAKPTVAFFPQTQAIFSTCGQPEGGDTRQLLVAGFTARDLACLAFIDRFFADHPADDLYMNSRSTALVIGVSGYCGVRGALLPLAEKGCDLELVCIGEAWLAIPGSEAGERLVVGLPEAGDAERAQLDELRAKGRAVAQSEDALILQVAGIVQKGLIPDSFWSEIGDRCIACTGCNLVCPTCTCFGVQDWRYAGGVERSRMWDSCQLEGFMREASGHNPLGSEGQRTRRRIHHKLAADPLRWGEISCFVCGRCDAVCPTGIGIQSVAAEIVARFAVPD